jgi:hypothetical protein
MKYFLKKKSLPRAYNKGPLHKLKLKLKKILLKNLLFKNKPCFLKKKEFLKNKTIFCLKPKNKLLKLKIKKDHK